MNNNIKELLQEFKNECLREKKQQIKEYKKVNKEILTSTEKAYYTIWEEILEQYKMDIQTKKQRDVYTVAINIINLDEVIELAKRRIIKADVSYLEDINEYSKISSDEIIGVEIDYETMAIVSANKLFASLHQDGIEKTDENHYGININDLKSYIEISYKKRRQATKSKKRKK